MGSVIRNPNQMLHETLRKEHSNFGSFKGKSKVHQRVTKVPPIAKYHTYYIDKKLQNLKSNKTTSVKHHFVLLGMKGLKGDRHRREKTTIELRNLIMEHDDSKFFTDEFANELLEIRLVDLGILD